MEEGTSSRSKSFNPEPGSNLADLASPGKSKSRTQARRVACDAADHLDSAAGGQSIDIDAFRPGPPEYETFALSLGKGGRIMRCTSLRALVIAGSCTENRKSS